MARVVGIDYGLARIGIAISDENQLIAFPFMTLEAEKKSENTVTKLLNELEKTHYDIEEIVVGFPLMMSGKKGWLADEVNHFVDLLRKMSQIHIVTWDERLSTVQAERSLREGKMTYKKRKKLIDKVSAVIILQNYLDHKLRMKDED